MREHSSSSQNQNQNQNQRLFQSNYLQISLNVLATPRKQLSLGITFSLARVCLQLHTYVCMYVFIEIEIAASCKLDCLINFRVPRVSVQYPYAIKTATTMCLSASRIGRQTDRQTDGETDGWMDGLNV